LLPNPTFAFDSGIGSRNVKQKNNIGSGPAGPEYSSPRQRPGYAIQPIVPALKGRNNAAMGWFPLSGLPFVLGLLTQGDSSGFALRSSLGYFILPSQGSKNVQSPEREACFAL
jgi:hypothetical protein